MTVIYRPSWTLPDIKEGNRVDKSLPMYIFKFQSKVACCLYGYQARIQDFLKGGGGGGDGHKGGGGDWG